MATKRTRATNFHSFENELQRSVIRKSENYLVPVRIFSVILNFSTVFSVDSIPLQLFFILVIIGESYYLLKSTRSPSNNQATRTMSFFIGFRLYIEFVSMNSLRIALISNIPGCSEAFLFSILAETLLNLSFPSCSRITPLYLLANFFCWQLIFFAIHHKLCFYGALIQVALSFFPFFLNKFIQTKITNKFREFFGKTKEAEKVYRLQDQTTFPMLVVELSENYPIKWANIEGKELQRKCGSPTTFPQLFFGEYESLVKGALDNPEAFLPKMNSCVFPIKMKKNQKETPARPNSSHGQPNGETPKPQVPRINEATKPQMGPNAFPEFTCEFSAKIVREEPKSLLFVTIFDVTMISETFNILKAIFDKSKKMFSSISLESLHRSSKDDGPIGSLEMESSLLHEVTLSKMTSHTLEDILHLPTAFQEANAEPQESGITQFNLRDTALSVFLSLANSTCIPPERVLCFDFIDDFNESIQGSFDSFEEVLSIILKTLIIEGEAQKLYCQILIDSQSQGANSSMSYNSFASSLDDMTNIGMTAVELTPQLSSLCRKQLASQNLLGSSSNKGVFETARFEFVVSINEKVNPNLFVQQATSRQELVDNYIRTGSEVDLVRLTKMSLQKLLNQIKGKLSIKRNVKKNLMIVSLCIQYNMTSRSPSLSSGAGSKLGFVNGSLDSPKLLVSNPKITVLWKESRRKTRVLKIDTFTDFKVQKLIRTGTIRDLSVFLNEEINGENEPNTSVFKPKKEQTGKYSLLSPLVRKKSPKETPFARPAIKPIKRINLDKFFQKGRNPANKMSVVMESNSLEEITSTVFSLEHGKVKKDSKRNSQKSIGYRRESREPSIGSILNNPKNSGGNSTKSSQSKAGGGKTSAEKKGVDVMNQLRSLEPASHLSSSKNTPKGSSSGLTPSLLAIKHREEVIDFIDEKKQKNPIKKQENAQYSFEDFDRQEFEEAKLIKEFIEQMAESIFTNARIKDLVPGFFPKFQTLQSMASDPFSPSFPFTSSYNLSNSRNLNSPVLNGRPISYSCRSKNSKNSIGQNSFGLY